MEHIWGLVEGSIRFFLARILHMELPEKKMKDFLQFFKFGIVGLSNTVVSYVLYAVALLAFQLVGMSGNVDYLAAQLAAFILSVPWSFYWNNKYVFADEDGGRNLPRTLLKTYISYGFTGLFLNSILSVLWVQALGIGKFLAPIMNLLVSVPLNFMINKSWAFK